MTQPTAPRKIALVDPVRTSQTYIAELLARKCDFVVVESGLVGALPRAAGVTVVAEPTPVDTARALREMGITEVIGCVDPSINYADQLCAQMGTVFNGLRLSEARCNKAKMCAAVNAAGIRTPYLLETDHLKDALSWIRNFPVVVKPVSSGGTDNVYLCHSKSDVTDAFNKILGQKNLMGRMNDAVLVQEYIDGTEYAIDCVSLDGRHALIDIFQYQKGTHNGRAFIYEKEFYLRPESPVGKALQAFTQQVLDALDFRIGASHTEVKINSKGEIVFIEVGARLGGGDMHLLVQDAREDCTGQMEHNLNVYLERKLPDPDYRTKQGASRVYIIANETGRLAGFRNLDVIKSLESYRRMHLNAAVGKDVSLTTDLTNDAGWIDLSHADPDVLQADAAQLDDLLRLGVLIFE